MRKQKDKVVVSFHNLWKLYPPVHTNYAGNQRSVLWHIIFIEE